MQFLALFYKFSLKHQKKLQLSISLKKTPGNNVLKSKVKPMRETLWVERHTTFKDLINFNEKVIHYLESIQRKNDPDNCFDSKIVREPLGLVKQFQNTGFIM